MTTIQTGFIPEITVAHRLRIAREVAGIDQSTLADRAEIGRTTIVNYEQGHRTPRRLYLRAIADVLGVDLNWLETGKAPADADANPNVRHEGFEPPTFWSVVSLDDEYELLLIAEAVAS